ncbi:unnamed protein product [Orchesella dallaii]|uniref:Ephrin RBD domain-containing protein n=1 Tax=Orchesella dallaii TaxID=48710 RepID=A0ABP1RSV5_9HEXA
MYFTITFRSFTPQPGGLEFRPGQDYYFISTSSRDDLHRRVGGRCSTHNMKVVFKVCCHPGETSSQSTTSAPALPQIPRFSTPRVSTASSATLSPRRPVLVYNSSASTNIGRFNGSIIHDNELARPQGPIYSNGGSSSSSSPVSTSTTIIPPPPFPAHPPVTRYPPKKTQYTNNPNYKPPSKKKDLEKHPNEVVKNEELTSGASSSMLRGHQMTIATTLLFSILTLVITIRNPLLFSCVR